MRINPLFVLLLIGLGAVGTWGTLYIFEKQTSEQQVSTQEDQLSSAKPQTFKQTLANELKRTVAKIESSLPRPPASDTPSAELAYADVVQRYLSEHRPHEAARYIQNLYSELSSEELDALRRLFALQASKYQRDSESEIMKQLYLAGAELFDDVVFWDAAARISETQKDWPGALSSLRRSTALESRSDVLEKKLLKLVKYASRLRAYYESLGDQLGIRDLYKSLYDEYPNYPRFQLELAQSHLRLGDRNAALPLLKILQYDPDLGVIAQQKLIQLQSSAEAPVALTEEIDPDRRPSDIVVPLRRMGSSFGVNTSIDGRQITMLLDTGASITGLSTSLIESLELPATGQLIQLNTANGVATSRLFRVEKMRLGRVYIEEAVIAEINLQGTSSFQGLLGTDLLNQADPDYSYVIDNAKGALIFRRK